MARWWSRIRAVLVVGLLWGGAWFGVGMILLVVVGPEAADVPFPLFFGLLGFLAGAAFSGLLAATERSRRFDKLSLSRFAVWGALGGVVLAAVFTLAAGAEFVVLATVLGVAGAASAAGTLVLARRAEGSIPADARVGSTGVGMNAKPSRKLSDGGD